MPAPGLLIVSCNPPENHPFDADRIASDVRRALGDGPVRVELRPDLHFEELSPFIEVLRPTLLNFIGHGLRDGRLVMKDRDGVARDFDPDAVTEVLCRPEFRPSLILLSACYSEPLGQKLKAGGVPFVVATTQEVPDVSTGAFSKAFFAALGRGETVTSAFAAGRGASLGEAEGAGDRFVLLCADGADATSARFATGQAPTPAILPAEVRQFVLWLDVDRDQPSQIEIEHQLPSERRGERLWLRLSDHDGPRLDREREAVLIPWNQLAQAIAAMGRALRLHRQTDGGAVCYYVVGRAPLAAFAHLGFEASSWGAPVTLLNQRRGGDWDLIPLDGPASPERFFDRTGGLEGTSLAQGRLDIYISCFGDDAPPSLGRLQAPGLEARAGTVVLSTQSFKAVDAATGPTIATELVAALSGLRNAYPEHARITLAIRGSAPLAFMAGRALNARMERALLLDFAGNDYRPAWQIPWTEVGTPPLDLSEPRGVAERLEILVRLRDAVDQLQRQIQPEHLIPPRASLRADEDPLDAARRLRTRLLSLRVDPLPGAAPFEISVARQRLSFGPGLLEGMRGLAPATLGLLGPLFVLHELLHFDQRLTGLVYQGVGRAGVVLEEIDYHADAFALAALTRLRLSRGGLAATERCGELLAEAIDAHIGAMMAFDRMEQGQRLDRLAERRLRRYLIWALQRARAETARDPGDLERLLDQRLFVELAPLQGTLSGQWDKVVLGPGEDTQLFIALGARLLRLPALPQNFSPAGLVTLVRERRQPELLEQMATVVELAPGELVPWVR